MVGFESARLELVDVLAAEEVDGRGEVLASALEALVDRLLMELASSGVRSLRDGVAHGLEREVELARGLREVARLGVELADELGELRREGRALGHGSLLHESAQVAVPARAPVGEFLGPDARASTSR